MKLQKFLGLEIMVARGGRNICVVQFSSFLSGAKFPQWETFNFRFRRLLRQSLWPSSQSPVIFSFLRVSRTFRKFNSRSQTFSIIIHSILFFHLSKKVKASYVSLYNLCHIVLYFYSSLRSWET